MEVKVGLELVLFLQQTLLQNGGQVSHGLCSECKPRVEARHPAVALDSEIAQKHKDWVQKRIRAAKLQEEIEGLGLELAMLDNRRQVLRLREGI